MLETKRTDAKASIQGLNPDLARDIMIDRLHAPTGGLVFFCYSIIRKAGSRHKGVS